MSKFISVSGNLLLEGNLTHVEQFTSQLLIKTLERCQALGLGHAKAIIEQGNKKLFASTTGLPPQVDFKGSQLNTKLNEVRIKVTVIMAVDFSQERLEESYLNILNELGEKFQFKITGEKIAKH